MGLRAGRVPGTRGARAEGTAGLAPMAQTGGLTMVYPMPAGHKVGRMKDMEGGQPMTASQLRELQNIVPSREQRVDINTIRLDMDAPAAVRAEQYLRQIKNPYAFRCGNVAVNVRFSHGGKPLAQAMQSYLAALAGR